MLDWARIVAIIRKERIHITRDPTTLILIIVLPIIQLTIFGFAVNMDIKNLPATVINLDRGVGSANYGQVLFEDLRDAQDATGAKRFRLLPAGFKDNSTIDFHAERLRADLVAGLIRMGLIIPPGFTQSVKEGRAAAPILLLDGSDATTSRQALFFTRGVVLKRGVQWMKARMPSFMRQFLPGDKTPIEISERVLFNPDLKSANFFVPGLLGVVMMMLTVILTAVSIARERERGSLEALVVTPISPLELMLGKLVPYAVVAFIDFCLVMALMVGLFQVQIAGNLLILLGFSMVFLYTCLAMGLMVSTVAQNQTQAFLMAMGLTMLPGILLSGFIFPRESMPWPLFAIGTVVPLTYFIEILRGLILRGAGPEALWHQVLPLLILGVVLMAASAHRFKKTLA